MKPLQVIAAHGTLDQWGNPAWFSQARVDTVGLGYSLPQWIGSIWSVGQPNTLIHSGVLGDLL